jgi:PIN domain nuclease of toxin-antitoxin system
MTWMLDTHALIWALFEPEKLGAKARGILDDSRNEVMVSPLSYWEISLKSGLGKLQLPGTDPEEIPSAAKQLGLVEMPLIPETLSTYHQLPPIPDHRDPFDRMIIWQCIRGKHTLLSCDRVLAAYRFHGLEFDW